MVKSIVSILIASLLLFAAVLFESIAVEEDFSSFRETLTTLERKAEEGTATKNDASAVLLSWEEKKERLHVWIPHNDINKIDDYLSEAARYVEEGLYPDALSKIEIVLHLTKCLPDTYRPTLENVF